MQAGEIKVGAWGGNGGSEWDMGAADRITEIKIGAVEAIDAIVITFIRNDQTETKHFGSIDFKPYVVRPLRHLPPN